MTSSLFGMKVVVSKFMTPGEQRQVGDTWYVSQEIYDAMKGTQEAASRPKSTEEALLEAIRANPGEDSVRLEMADYYDEYGVVQAMCPKCGGTGFFVTTEEEYVLRRVAVENRGPKTVCKNNLVRESCLACNSTGAVTVDYRDKACEQRLAVLLRLIKADFRNPEPRLKYADVCEQYGRVLLAGFIRREEARTSKGTFVRGELPQVIPWAKAGYGDTSEYYWGADGKTTLWKKGEIREACAMLPVPRHYGWHATFYRGFVDEVFCASADWLTHGDAILGAHPVRDVTVNGPLPVRWLPPKWSNEGEWEVIGDPKGKRFKASEVDAKARELFYQPVGMFPPTIDRDAVFALRWPGVKLTVTDRSEPEYGTSDVVGAYPHAFSTLQSVVARQVGPIPPGVDEHVRAMAEQRVMEEMARRAPNYFPSRPVDGPHAGPVYDVSELRMRWVETRMTASMLTIVGCRCGVNVDLRPWHWVAREFPGYRAVAGQCGQCGEVHMCCAAPEPHANV